ncbi:hypothetical protein [Bartonella sp. MR63HLJHH]|uniref:hypothetical protein n=1 Tax=Bartonella sp. MR63HLJHH TaxID=3243558 RepID=UPI0035CF98B7
MNLFKSQGGAVAILEAGYDGAGLLFLLLSVEILRTGERDMDGLFVIRIKMLVENVFKSYYCSL